MKKNNKWMEGFYQERSKILRIRTPLQISYKCRRKRSRSSRKKTNIPKKYEKMNTENDFYSL